ncbi:hypothetical protein HK414_05230 [Ramlibacter terrae]|uniref:Calcium-binding protein n=1 Tax=Ramlibacter terrae TaxID=2732511 RepID=A0ABX6P2D0_9BURK|nr:hypothetical protein HK414_05230 [Ramlibacter terrae]
MAYDGEGGVDTLVNIEGLRGSRFNDVLTGGNVANDAFEFFIGMGGNDTIDGGSGYDRADYNTAADAVSANLQEGIAYDGLGGLDTLVNVEGLRGGGFNDHLTGSTVANRLEGGLGDDTLLGGAGDDTLVGDKGNDSMVGDVGRDIFGWGPSSAGDTDWVEDPEVGDSLYFTGLSFEELLDVSPSELQVGQATLAPRSTASRRSTCAMPRAIPASSPSS